MQISSKSDAICENLFLGEGSRRDSLPQKGDEPSRPLGLETFKSFSRSTAASKSKLVGLKLLESVE